ncbi:carbamoyltransferase HypF [Namhaeicola litoreus]|uniref:Carbamoyltransferase n=1 Tax=Namhaeicola litoreus TaxID=1052145 RepID=A0ABW3Y1U0_9FLAO
MTFEISFSGQVQGVGFRPFVFNLAKKHGLKGFVSNNENGVIIQATGCDNLVHQFYQEIILKPPPLALIKDQSIKQIPDFNFDSFKILKSSKSEKLNLPLTPDFAICKDCQSELLDQNNKRFNYPFTTCVNCGPRWSVTKNFPFDRANTTLAEKVMCENCTAEYEAPSNRRFHSQTNTCSDCGFQLCLADTNGEILSTNVSNIFTEIGQVILDGAILALKNTSGFLLCCDARNKEAIQNLRKRKRRPNKPFAILYPSLTLVKEHFKICDEEEQLLGNSVSPVVILSHLKSKNDLLLNHIAPGLKQIGVMLPYTGILKLLSETLQIPLVATSGNIHGSPILSENGVAFGELIGVADFFLVHDLNIFNPQDDSVIKYSSKNKQKIIFRRSRGLAPSYFGFKEKSKKTILALGAHLKSTIAFLPNDHIYVSQYLGNLDHFEVYQRFTKTTSYFLELFEQRPELLLIDAHPAYQSSLFGKELSKKFNSHLIKVQHHIAHFASVLGEHTLFDHDRVLGVVWDGTGFGSDAQIWGGEFFLYENKEIERVGHFEYFNWLAGDKMSLEPRLSLLSLADETMSDLLATKFTNEELKLYHVILKKNQLKTSSVGRLFDAVASLLGICDLNSYVGEAAILLENNIVSLDFDKEEFYPFKKNSKNISPKLIIKSIFKDLQKGISQEKILSKFMFTLAKIIFYMAEKQKVKEIALSGGVFQNASLVDLLIDLKGKEYNLYFNESFSPNDENISFGQMMYALHIEKLGS